MRVFVLPLAPCLPPPPDQQPAWWRWSVRDDAPAAVGRVRHVQQAVVWQVLQVGTTAASSVWAVLTLLTSDRAWPEPPCSSSSDDYRPFMSV